MGTPLARSAALEKRSRFQCNDWGENEKLELAVVKERFRLAATVAPSPAAPFGGK